MTLRATFDTNVHVSALNYEGPPAQLLALAALGAFQLQLSDAILDEISRVLLEYFNWNSADIQDARTMLQTISQHVHPHIILNVVERDPDDNHILECSQASRSDYIVTKDKHLLDLKIYAGARIIKPHEFLCIMQQHAQEL
jgi:putative PIN family toxin of toxin-antitoxin system